MELTNLMSTELCELCPVTFPVFPVGKLEVWEDQFTAPRLPAVKLVEWELWFQIVDCIDSGRYT